MNNPMALIVPPSNETAATAAASQVKALVEARYTIAIARPRDIDAVREALMKECRRPSFAEVARYNKPVGKGIVGPSIRFAEAAARCMTNIVIDTVTVYDDDEKRILQVSVADLEANVPYTQSITIDKTVERRNMKDGDELIRKRTNKNGEIVHIIRATEDDLLNKANAQTSKAIRTLVLRLVPGDIVDECMFQVVKTQQDKDAKDPDGARLKIVDSFAVLNVTVADLKSYVGTDLNKLSPAELADLRALHAAIKEGETTWRAAMEARSPGTGTASRMSDDFGTKKEAPPTEKKTEAKGAPGITKEQLIAMAKTKDGEEVDRILQTYSLHSFGDAKTPQILATLAAEINKLPTIGG
jgi:hypothetical protein